MQQSSTHLSTVSCAFRNMPIGSSAHIRSRVMKLFCSLPQIPHPELPHATRAVSAERPTGGDTRVNNRTVLQQHVDFFDQDKDGQLPAAHQRRDALSLLLQPYTVTKFSAGWLLYNSHWGSMGACRQDLPAGHISGLPQDGV